MNNQFNNRSYNVSITDVYKISLTLLQALKSYPLFWNNSVVIGRSSSMWPTYISVYEQNETKTTLPKWYICNVSSAWRDQMSSSDSVATATENTSRLGYKHVSVNDLHVASHDYQYQEVIQHTHTSTHSLTRSLTHRMVCFVCFSRSTPTSVSTRIQVENESSKYYWIKNISHKHVISMS